MSFSAGSRESSLQEFTLFNDVTALETDEEYTLSITSHNFAGMDQVLLGPDTDITIVDDDGML